MITTVGKTRIKRYMARQLPNIATHINLGVGTAPETLADASLQYEVLKLPIQSTSIDLENNLLILKAEVSPGSIGTIREVGLSSFDQEVSTGNSLGFLAGSPWENASFSTDHAFISTTSLRVDFSANGTTNATLSDVNFSLNPASSIQFAYYATSNLSSVRLRLGTDSSNYFEFYHDNPVEGFNVYRIDLSQAIVVGTPSLSTVSYLAVRPSGRSDGAGSIYLNGIREVYNTFGIADFLVARKVLATPVAVDPDIPTTIEYPLVINV